MRKAAAKEGGQYMANVCRSVTCVAQMLQTLPLCAVTGGPQLPVFGIVTQNVMCVNAVRPGQLHWAHVHRGKVSVHRARIDADLQREGKGAHGHLQGQPNFLS